MKNFKTPLFLLILITLNFFGTAQLTEMKPLNRQLGKSWVGSAGKDGIVTFIIPKPATFMFIQYKEH